MISTFLARMIDDWSQDITFAPGFNVPSRTFVKLVWLLIHENLFQLFQTDHITLDCTYLFSVLVDFSFVEDVAKDRDFKRPWIVLRSRAWELKETACKYVEVTQMLNSF